jgi:hypothetical protein
MWLKASAVVVMLHKILFLKTLKMGQTSGPETLVIHQKTTPGKNPEDFMQQKLCWWDILLRVEQKSIGSQLEMRDRTTDAWSEFVLIKCSKCMHTFYISYQKTHKKSHSTVHITWIR